MTGGEYALQWRYKESRTISMPFLAPLNAYLGSAMDASRLREEPF